MIFPNLKLPITKNIYNYESNDYVCICMCLCMCNVKWVAHGDLATDNYDPTLHCPSAVQSILASFSLLFWFSGPHLYCCGSPVTALINAVSDGRQLFSSKNSEALTVHFLPTIKLVRKLKLKLVNIVEQLAAKKQKISLRISREQNRA